MTNPSRVPSAEADPAEAVERLKVEAAHAQQELRICKESLQRSQGALCAIADGLAIVDSQGCITCLNPVGAHLTGWTEEESLGRSLAEVVHLTDGRGKALDVLVRGFSNESEGVVSLVRRDRHVVLVNGTVAPIRDPGKRVIGSVVTFRNVTAAARLNRDLFYHANHDALTGLHNRRAFDSQLKRAVSAAARFECSHAMLYFDLDYFKVVNDTGGHVAGDELLRQLAALLRRQLREHDTLARIGGDEIAALLENCTAAHAANVAEKIRSAIEGFAFEWKDRTFRIGTSIGQVTFGNENMSAQEIIDAADHMCYVAKMSGRNQVAAYAAQNPHTTATGHVVSHRQGARQHDIGFDAGTSRVRS